MSSRAKRPDRTHHDWVSLAVPVGAAYLLVPGLQPHTQYQFSVLAQNKLGSGPFSEIILSAPEGERPLSPEQLMGWEGTGGRSQDMGRPGGRRQRCWAAWLHRALGNVLQLCLLGLWEDGWARRW